ncbi:hypothetical protein [Paenibacillus tepidiphilus]|uniref:hypothetical protein n=1 Tax=Paenibacillus tepidiphilus TaxID=2608683 RepID=UPI00123ABD5F|nr:hypothetical protein [Paenibacillus tepidiphilus]
MRAKTFDKRPNSFKYLKLNNLMDGATFPVSVDYTFLTELLSIEKSYQVDSPILFRKQSHPVRTSHITGMSLRLMMTIFRRFNTEGSLLGVPIHKLYQLMNEEYEKPASKEQFYAEVQKFINLGLISVSNDGIVNEWKIEAFRRKTGRFILFNPIVFTKKFTDLEIAAQKLYLYLVSRNGSKIHKEFKEYIGSGSWINTLTHKARPAQIKTLMNSLANLEPVPGHPLLETFSVEKDSWGRWFVSCKLNSAYLVNHREGNQYRMVPEVKISYSKTVNRVKSLLHYYKIAEIEVADNGRALLLLTQILRSFGMKSMRYAILRLKDLINRNGWMNITELVQSLKVELQDRSFIAYMNVLKETNIYQYLGIKENDPFDNARPLQFFRAIKDKIPFVKLRKTCHKALPLLQKQFGISLDSTFLSIQSPGENTRYNYDTFYLEDLLISLKN